MPISIIVDDSTDAGNIHYKIVYFQTIEEVNPVIYFYKLIKLESATGFGGFEALRKAWESEKSGFSQYMQHNLIGFASDGAATNLGQHSGTLKYIKDWTKNSIFSIHCMSHRLELSIQHAFNQTIDFETNSRIVSEYIDSTINKVYSFYNSYGYKRIAHLKDTCERNGFKYYALSKIIHIRWIASDFKAMKALSIMWRMIVEDLDAITNGRDFETKTRNKAEILRPKLMGKYFLLLFHFLFDIVNELSVLSLEMQKRTALIIDFQSMKSRFENIFTHLKSKNGRYLQIFLNEALCESDLDTDPEPCNSQVNYVASQNIIYKGISLMNDESDIPEINEYRTIMLDLLLAEFKKYFPDGNLNYFNVFDPKEMPNVDDYVGVRTYGILEIKELNHFFKISEDDIILDNWHALLNSIVSNPNYCQIKNGRTSVFAFWSQILKWSDIEWHDDVKRLLFCVLSLPISSAEAERGFSTLKYIRDTHRNRLTPESLDATLRIKLNGPDELEYFAAAKYALKWIKTGHFATDSRVQVRKGDTISLLEENNRELRKKYLLKSTIF